MKIPGNAGTNSSAVVHFRPRRKRAPRESANLSLNLAPMVDVVFLLLLFFISTTTFRRAEGLLASKLPKEGGFGTAVEIPITPIVVHIRQTGQQPTDYNLMVEGFVNTPATFSELADFLRELQSEPGFDDQTPVVLEAGADVMWDHVVGAWNAAVRAGCKKISFGGAKQTHDP